jgi:hypothetical protein
MKKMILAGLFLATLSVLSGCVSGDRVTHVRAEGGIARVDPALGQIELGYGNFGFDQATVRAGQGVVIRSDQYGLTTSNLLSSQIFAVIPYGDSTVTVTQTQKALFSLLGIGVLNPFSNPITIFEVRPAGTSTNSTEGAK